MNGDKVRLNEIVSPKEMKDRRRGPIHLLNNSLRRNTILTLGSFKHHLPCTLPPTQTSANFPKSTCPARTSPRC